MVEDADANGILKDLEFEVQLLILDRDWLDWNRALGPVGGYEEIRAIADTIVDEMFKGFNNDMWSVFNPTLSVGETKVQATFKTPK